MEFIALSIMCIAIGLVGVAEGLGVAKGLEAVGRNPAAANTIRTNMIIGLALVETCAIYSFVIAILFLFIKM